MLNDLQRFLELKDITLRQVARETEVGYHSLQKVVKGVRETPSIRQAIASYFHVSPEVLWGPTSHNAIKYLMEREIEHQAAAKREELRKRYLGNNRDA